MAARLWEGELTRHVQRLVEQAHATIGSHAEEIRKAESVLESTLRELTSTRTFQEQMLDNTLDFLSKDFERRAAEIHRQYMCQIEELKAEVLEKANSQNKQCEEAIQRKAAELSAALQAASTTEKRTLSTASPDKKTEETHSPPPPLREQDANAPQSAPAEAPLQEEKATTVLDESREPQTVQKAVTHASPNKSPLEDVVRNLKPQRLERALSEVRDWLAESTGAATTPVDASVFSPSSVAAEQGSVNGASLLSPLTPARPQTPVAYSRPSSPGPNSRLSDLKSGGRRELEKRNGNDQRSSWKRPSSPEAPRPLSLQAQALQLAERMRRDLERGPLINLTSPDGDLVPVKGTRGSPFRDSRPPPSIALPRSNPASPTRARSPGFRATSPLAPASARGAAREERAKSDPLDSPARRKAVRGGGVVQRRANSVAFGVGSRSKTAVRVIDLFQSDSESEDDQED
ncbi:hypothetical protein KFL_000940160 [Klebsormidium nitens]|uniref:Uncharacterized protein n=1 Tax=Klebsormidium nitens TaxID=105231 RepID=A0A1Y1HZG0_KLENI|nr:hypothetical protein KFL_000940160 [Klebsormidium nitens]|eukprot:GAQ81906.1 hypothetical protein KFL_000940160 [Klebsormidium nitens]